MGIAIKGLARLGKVAAAAACLGIIPAGHLGAEPAGSDPLEPVNRMVYTFNRQADRYVLRPLAAGYDRVTPAPIQAGIGNFFDNLGEPVVVLNALGQAKVVDAGFVGGRFLINSTLGLLGFIDVAGRLGLPRQNEDFGQTLGVWGLPAGWYLVIPFWGGSSVRDATGLLVDWQLDPLNRATAGGETYALVALNMIDTRAQYLQADELLETIYDPYAFTRNAYFQRRAALIRDDSPEKTGDQPPPWEEEGIAPPWEQ